MTKKKDDEKEEVTDFTPSFAAIPSEEMKEEMKETEAYFKRTQTTEPYEIPAPVIAETPKVIAEPKIPPDHVPVYDTKDGLPPRYMAGQLTALNAKKD